MKREIFTYLTHTFDVDKADKLIVANRMSPVSMNIESWATQLLGLDRKLGWDNKKILVMGISINAEYAQEISEDRRDEPGTVVKYVFNKEGDEAMMVIDGNHRLARRYMDGFDEMEFYYLNGELAKEVTTDQFAKYRVKR